MLFRSPRLAQLLKDKQMQDVLVLLGGIIPDADIPEMKEQGVAAVFQPGASLDEIVKFIQEKTRT